VVARDIVGNAREGTARHQDAQSGRGPGREQRGDARLAALILIKAVDDQQQALARRRHAADGLVEQPAAFGIAVCG